jgi:hypothetical protein
VRFHCIRLYLHTTSVCMYTVAVFFKLPSSIHSLAHGSKYPPVRKQYRPVYSSHDQVFLAGNLQLCSPPPDQKKRKEKKRKAMEDKRSAYIKGKRIQPQRPTTQVRHSCLRDYPKRCVMIAERIHNEGMALAQGIVSAVQDKKGRSCRVLCSTHLIYTNHLFLAKAHCLLHGNRQFLL